MPEGPEVTVIKDGLNTYLKGNMIISVSIPDGSKFQKKSPDGFNEFKSALPLKVTEVKSKGKFIYFLFENNWILMCRLLMSGGWYLNKAPKHNHIELEYQSGSKSSSIWFVDSRHFGTLKWSNKQTDLDAELNKLGPDLLNDTVTEDQYLKKMKENSKKNIALVMMDQSVFSGIGNYLKSEILYEAKVSPHAIINNIPDVKLKELFKISIDKINSSYKSGGASVRNYSDIKGKDGQYAFNFQVYQKKIDPLGNKIKSEKTKDGRTTHWVPSLQNDYSQ
uniref:Formamidopyrimidine-DNA glycosylase catalytic domain-containing protein n=1 Tax=viral metagenome TaxID=1070528 RepID=A0A6C0E7L1_9ZZZZ